MRATVLPGTRLADQAQGLAPGDGKGDSMDDEVLLRPAKPAILPGIIFGEAADFEQGHGAIVDRPRVRYCLPVPRSTYFSTCS